VGVGGQDDLDDELIYEINSGKFEIVYFTPESLVLNSRWRRMLSTEVYQKHLKAIAVDEAHTVPKW